MLHKASENAATQWWLFGDRATFFFYFSKRAILLLIKRRTSNLNVLLERLKFKMYVLPGGQLRILLCKIFHLFIIFCTEAQYALFKYSVN